MKYESQEYVLGGPLYGCAPPLRRYRKMFRSEDGDVLHLLETPDSPEKPVIVRDDEIRSIASRRFFSYGNQVYCKVDDLVVPREFCSVGDGVQSIRGCCEAASRLADFLNDAPDSWVREVYDLLRSSI